MYCRGRREGGREGGRGIRGGGGEKGEGGREGGRRRNINILYYSVR